jgi:hypothetical protein
MGMLDRVHDEKDERVRRRGLIDRERLLDDGGDYLNLAAVDWRDEDDSLRLAQKARGEAAYRADRFTCAIHSRDDVMNLIWMR